MPQGSVLGPVIFIIYVASVINIARAHGFNAHSYADDLHILRSLAAIFMHQSSGPDVNLHRRNEWMASNRQKLNPTKTELNLTRISSTVKTLSSRWTPKHGCEHRTHHTCWWGHFTHSSRLICCLRYCRSFHSSYSSSQLVRSWWSISWLVLILSLTSLSGSLNQWFNVCSGSIVVTSLDCGLHTDKRLKRIT